MSRLGSESAAEAFESLLAQSAAFATSEDPEVVHQLRVAVRRLRVALRLFKGTLERELEESLSADLKWFLGKLGALRDLHVFSASLAERTVPGTPGEDALVRSIEDRTAQLRQALLEVLAGRRYHRLVEDVRTLVARLPRHGPRKARFVRRLGKQRQRTLAALRAMLEDETKSHTARKELKKLRYGCELGAPLFPKVRARRYQKCMKDVQERLGANVDLSVWLMLVRVHCRAKPLREQLVAQFNRERALQTACLAAPIQRLSRARPPWG